MVIMVGDCTCILVAMGEIGVVMVATGAAMEETGEVMEEMAATGVVIDKM